MTSPRLDQQRLQRLVEAGRALVSRRELEDVLAHLLNVARELTGARYAAIGVLDARRERLARFLTAGVDHGTRRRIGELPRGRGVLGVLITDPRPLRLADVSTHPASFGFPAGHPPMRTFLGVPITVRGQAFGNLYLTEKEGGDFDLADEDAVIVLADWAAIAIENARWAADERLRHSIEAAEQERRRWARELHDETLQGLGGLQVLLASGLRRGNDSALRDAVRDGLAQIGIEIANLRALITELRPAALDEIGLVPAIETLAERISAVDELAVETNIDLTLEEPQRLPPDIESTVYRMVQEALTNATKHAGASLLRVELLARDGSLEVSVTDDGCGFDPERVAGGFGLTGMRERVALVGGSLRIESVPRQGTTVTASIPVPQPNDQP
jgi:signal transduction histidine kinase